MKQIKTATEKKKVDWNEVHRRMETAAAGIQESLEPDAAEKKRILKERAKALARENKSEKTLEDSLEIVVFVLAGERYGIITSFVREIYPLKELVPVPCTPAFVLGVTNVRGQILSVIDIKKFFDLPEKGLTELDKIIIVKKGAMEAGIRVDIVSGVLSIPVSQIQPSLPTLTGIREKYLKGLTLEHIAILDVEKMLSDKNLIVNEDIK